MGGWRAFNVGRRRARHCWPSLKGPSRQNPCPLMLAHPVCAFSTSAAQHQLQPPPLPPPPRTQRDQLLNYKAIVAYDGTGFSVSADDGGFCWIWASA